MADGAGVVFLYRALDHDAFHVATPLKPIDIFIFAQTGVCHNILEFFAIKKNVLLVHVGADIA